MKIVQIKYRILSETKKFFDMLKMFQTKDEELNLKMFQTKVKNEELNLKEMNDKKIILKSTPRLMTIDPTNKCNIRCITCFGRYYKYPLADLSQANFNKLKPFIDRSITVNFNGTGETFLNQNISSMVSYCKDVGTIIGLISNGTLLRKNVDTIRCLKTLVISFDGGTKETFEKIRAGAIFDKVIDNIKYINSLNLDTALMFCVTISELNFNEMPLILNIARDIGVSTIQFNQIICFHDDMKYMLINEKHKDKLKQIIEETEKLAKLYGIGCTFGIKNCINNCANKTASPVKPLSIYCTVPWRTMFVASNGNIKPCCVYNKLVGNLGESAIEDVWNNQAYQSLRASMVGLKDLEDCCKNCNDAQRFL